MGERKGQNKYYPPDFDYKKHKSLNHYHGTHALRERAAKLGQGIMIIRFEMPFNIWCLGCHNHVGMGVRYNAEKKKCGMYYTTPLFEFRMKCHLCDNYFVIRTDPGNFDYELVEGCRRQEKRFDPSTIDGAAPIDRQMTHKLAADAMFKVEHLEEDKTKASSDEKQLDKLEWIQERLRDDFAANQALRRSFRSEKKLLTEQRAIDSDLRARTSLQIKLLPESEDDKKVAGMLKRYANVKSYDEHQTELREAISAKRIFDPAPSTSKSDPEDAKSSAGKRIIASLKQDKGRRLNEQFTRFGEKNEQNTVAALGIVRKKPKTEDAESVVSDSSASRSTPDPEIIWEEKPVKKEEDAKPSNGLVADYSGSSSSDGE